MTIAVHVRQTAPAAVRKLEHATITRAHAPKMIRRDRVLSDYSFVQGNSTVATGLFSPGSISAGAVDCGHFSLGLDPGLGFSRA